MKQPENGNQHDSKHARQAEHELNHKIRHGESFHHAMQDEIHHLRQLDTHHGHLNKRQFQHDLKELKHYAQHKHLPGLHLDHGHHGAHNPLHPHPHEGANHHGAGAASRETPQAPHREAAPAPHATIPGSSAAAPADRTASAAAGAPQETPARPTDNSAWQPRVAPPSLDRPGAPGAQVPDVTAPQPGADAGVAGPQTVGGGHLAAAVERAKAGGRPLQITQIGDSHIHAGVETPALAGELAKDAGLNPGQVTQSSYGEVGKTATDANRNSDRFLQNVNASTDLVVLSFGSNEGTGQVGAQYQRDYAQLIAKIHAKAPNAAIVMTGPTDGNFWGKNQHLPGLDSVVRAQGQVASQVSDSQYIDVRPQMGTLAQMQSQGWVRSDHLHLTNQGYDVLGHIVADDIYRNLSNL